LTFSLASVVGPVKIDIYLFAQLYKFRLQVGNTTGGSFGIPVQWGSVSAELERTTTELAGKSMAISFRPATIADQQTLETYLPENP